MTVVSIQAVADAQGLGLGEFDLVVSDEAQALQAVDPRSGVVVELGAHRVHREQDDGLAFDRSHAVAQIAPVYAAHRPVFPEVFANRPAELVD
jgi:predicted helicase